MPIIELQRRLRQIGRIRIGEQVATGRTTKAGKPGTRPVKLSTFKLTSSDEQVIRVAAELYGGEPKPWAEMPGQWEVVTESAELPIAVPPGGVALSQWYETWSGGGCTRRCDGQFEQISDQPCLCSADERECKIHTRLSVVLADLPGLGLWRLDTQGYYAATELTGTVNLLEACAEAGRFLPARLRLEQREVKRAGKTMKFAVPCIDVDVRVLDVPALMAGGGRSIGALAPEVDRLALPSGADPETGELPPRPGLTPVPDVPAQPVADQVRAGDEPASKQRASTPKLPETNRPRRTAAEAAALDDDAPVRPVVVSSGRPASAPQAAAPPAPPADDEGPDGEDGPRMEPAQYLAMRCRDQNVNRAALIEAVTAGAKNSAKDLTLPEHSSALGQLDALKHRTVILEHNADHQWTFRTRDEDDDPCDPDALAEMVARIQALPPEQKQALIEATKYRILPVQNPEFSRRHLARVASALAAIAGEAPALEETVFETPAQPEAWEEVGQEHTWEPATWLGLLKARNVRQRELLDQAREIAAAEGVEPPAGLADFPALGELCRRLRIWVEDRAEEVAGA